MEYIAYTDGGCDHKSDRKIGAAAYIILRDNEIFALNSKSFCNTTVSRMEMLAIISAINRTPPGSTITVYSDSQPVICTFCGNKEYKNQDLIRLFRRVATGKRVNLEWIKGHSGNRWNQHCDSLVKSEIRLLRNKFIVV